MHAGSESRPKIIESWKASEEYRGLPSDLPPSRVALTCCTFLSYNKKYCASGNETSLFCQISISNLLLPKKRKPSSELDWHQLCDFPFRNKWKSISVPVIAGSPFCSAKPGFLYRRFSPIWSACDWHFRATTRHKKQLFPSRMR